MHLTGHEQERLMIYVASLVARERRSRGVKLNYPEAVALLTAHILEGVRDGRRSPNSSPRPRRCSPGTT